MLFMEYDPNKVSTDPTKAGNMPNSFFEQKKHETYRMLKKFAVLWRNYQFKILTPKRITVNVNQIFDAAFVFRSLF